MSKLQALDTISKVECRITPEMLIGAITTFLGNQSPAVLNELRSTLQREIDDAGPNALTALTSRLAAAGSDWTYFPPDPLARRLHHVLADRLLGDESAFEGIAHAQRVLREPVVIFANHLSYADANAFEVFLHRGGGAALTDRLTVMAGPKVYSSLARRFSSLCFGTIRTPQSSAVSTDDAVMNSRQVARAARRVLDIAEERRRLGDALLVFPEGRRSRACQLQPLLPGASRYLDAPGTWILPVGIVGTEAMFPVGEDAFRPVPIALRAGAPISGDELRERAAGDRRLMMDAIGLAISDLLPVSYQGAYGDRNSSLDNARTLLREVQR